MTDEKKSLKDALLADIHSGKLAMRSRFVYALKIAALSIISIAILFVTVFLVNIIFFLIRAGETDVLLGFGARGALSFLWFFPWQLVVIDAGLVVLFQWLLREFKFAYTTPVLYIAGFTLLGAVAVGFVLDRATPVNDLLHEGREHLPSPIRMLYEGAHTPLPKGSGICRCTIVSIDGNTLVVEDTRDATTTLTVTLPTDNRRATTTGLKVGDVIFIAGDEDELGIRAFGVRLDRARAIIDEY